MQSFYAYIPVDLKIELDARAPDVAADKATYAADFFLKGAGAYRLSLPGIGPITITLVPAELEEDDNGEPFVEPAPIVAGTLDKLGTLPTPADYAAPFEGTVLIPKDHPSRLPQPWDGSSGIVRGSREYAVTGSGEAAGAVLVGASDEEG